MNTKIIIFEGLDGSGKTTLIKYFNEMTGWKHFCIDRFIGSGIVYDEQTSRRNKEKLLYTVEASMNHIIDADIYVIFTYCNIDILKDRLEKKDDIINEFILQEQFSLFNKYCERTPFKVLRLDTGKYSLPDCVKQIRQFIGE